MGSPPLVHAGHTRGSKVERSSASSAPRAMSVRGADVCEERAFERARGSLRAASSHRIGWRLTTICGRSSPPGEEPLKTRNVTRVVPLTLPSMEQATKEPNEPWESTNRSAPISTTRSCDRSPLGIEDRSRRVPAATCSEVRAQLFAMGSSYRRGVTNARGGGSEPVGWWGCGQRCCSRRMVPAVGRFRIAGRPGE